MKGSIFTLRLTVLVALILSLSVYGYADFNDEGDQITAAKQIDYRAIILCLLEAQRHRSSRSSQFNL